MDIAEVGLAFMKTDRSILFEPWSCGVGFRKKIANHPPSADAFVNARCGRSGSTLGTVVYFFPDCSKCFHLIGTCRGLSLVFS